MKPEEFLTLAIRLSASPGEAEKRTAISRAYYAIFHAARLLVESCDIACPESAEAHDKVARCLQNSQNAVLIEAGDTLQIARTIRNRADYRLGDVTVVEATFVSSQMKFARGVFDALRAAMHDTSAVRSPIRAYAKDVLKLRVRD